VADLDGENHELRIADLAQDAVVADAIPPLPG